LLPLLTLLAACDSDPDGDGLTNAEERELGTGIKIADTDGDGVLDGAEVADGTDPLLYDTDSDGFSDGEEKAVGSDGIDPMSYPTDRWPDLSALVPDGERSWGLGNRMPAFDGADQLDGELDIDQLYGHVLWIQLVGGYFCSACADAATGAQDLREVHGPRGFWPVHILVDDDERDGELTDTFAKIFAARHDLTYPVLVDAQAPFGLFEAGLYTGNIPLTVLVDRQQRIHGVYEGRAGMTEAEGQLEALLSAPFPSGD
jgi:peroxiredoxin